MKDTRSRAYAVVGFRVGIPYDGTEAAPLVNRVQEVVKALDDAAAGQGCDVTFDDVKVAYRDPIGV